MKLYNLDQLRITSLWFEGLGDRISTKHPSVDVVKQLIADKQGEMQSVSPVDGLGFVIEERLPGLFIKQWDNGGGCMAATDEEVRMWQRLQALQQQPTEPAEPVLYDSDVTPASRLDDATINELTLHHLGKWPSFQAQAWACKVVHALFQREEYEVGGWYRKQGGGWVQMTQITGSPGYETMQDQHHSHRYCTRDFGRITASCHKYSNPSNTPPVYRLQTGVKIDPNYDRYSSWEVEDLRERAAERGLISKVKAHMFHMSRERWIEVLDKGVPIK